MKIQITILIFISLLFSCSENVTESDTPTETETKFSGITETSEDGSLIGNIDSDDWYYNSVTIDEPQVVPAYPNPTTGDCMFKNKKDIHAAKLKLVNL